MPVKLVVNIKPLEKALESALKQLTHTTPLMRALSESLHDKVMENFDAEGRPRWKPIKRDGKVLQNTGTLRSSIVTQYSDNDAAVGTNIEYAAIHHFGGKTRPHLIKAKRAKALSFNGKLAKSVNHPGSNIPARPFLTLTDRDLDDLEDTIADYLRKAF